MSDHYQILGVARGAEPAAIKAAYRRLALQYHPERNHSPGAVAEFQKVQRAYEVLSRPDMRHRYDHIRTYRYERSTTATKSSHACDRKYGTRHRFTNPPPTKAEQDLRYQKYLKEYALFTKTGMKLPRRIWRERFAAIRQEALRNYGWMIGMVLAMLALSISTFLYKSGSTGLIMLAIAISAGYDLITEKAPKSLAKRKAKEGTRASAKP